MKNRNAYYLLLVVALVILSMTLQGCNRTPCEQKSIGIIKHIEYFPPTTTLTGIGTAHYLLTLDDENEVILSEGDIAYGDIRTGVKLIDLCSGFYRTEPED